MINIHHQNYISNPQSRRSGKWCVDNYEQIKIFIRGGPRQPGSQSGIYGSDKQDCHQLSLFCKTSRIQRKIFLLECDAEKDNCSF